MLHLWKYYQGAWLNNLQVTNTSKLTSHGLCVQFVLPWILVNCVQNFFHLKFNTSTGLENELDRCNKVDCFIRVF